jgi:hypothetical protein
MRVHTVRLTDDPNDPVHVHDAMGRVYEHAYAFALDGSEVTQIVTPVHDQDADGLFSLRQVDFTVTWLTFRVPMVPLLDDDLEPDDTTPHEVVRVALHTVAQIDPPLADGELGGAA